MPSTTPEDAAFSCHGRVFGALYAIWEDEDGDAANIGWLRAAIDGVAPLCTGAYVGEADLDRPRSGAPDADPGRRGRGSPPCALQTIRRASFSGATRPQAVAAE